MKVEKVELRMEVYDSPMEAPAVFSSLLDAARKAMATAYAPFSGFSVGAAVLLEDGMVVCGSNQENSSFPQGLCAERVALFAAGAQFPHTPVQAIAVIASEMDESWISPCGGCRQVMVETEKRYGKAVSIILTNSLGQIAVVKPVSQLLPWCFDGHLLKR